MTQVESQTFLDRLSKILSGPLPGVVAHRRATPELAYGRHRGPIRNSSFQSAVLVGLVHRDDGWRIPLTLRPSHLPTHAGQVSFPGGRLGAGEDAWEAAQREFREELGVSTDRFELIGQLTPLQVFASRHWVIPFVAANPCPLDYVPNTHEVASIFELPVNDLLSATFDESKIQRRGLLEFHSPGISCQSHFIWGATAMILSEMRTVVERAL